MSTSIEWCDETWNPVVGCSRVSAGCDHCYAMGVAHRKMSPQHVGLTKLRPRDAKRPGVDWTGEVRCLPERLGEPLRWRKPRRVFVNSMSDLFHEQVPFEFVAKAFAVMAATSERHTYLVLTKRPARALEWYRWQEALRADSPHAVLWPERARERDRLERPPLPLPAYERFPAWPLPNVHLGVSAEDQATFDERVPLLLECPAAVRWVSAEPLLGPLHVSGSLPRVGRYVKCTTCGRTKKPIGRDSMDNGLCEHECPGWRDEPVPDVLWPGESDAAHRREHGPPCLDWIVLGGESGPGARPNEIGWTRSIVEQCRGAGVPVFVKQLGREPREYIPPSGAPDDGGDMRPLSLRDRKGGDMDEWPADLRVRELPEVNRA